MNSFSKRYHDFVNALSVGHKLLLISLLTTLVIFAGTIAIYVTNEFSQMRREEDEQFVAIATVVSRNVTAAIAFNDPQTAADMLSALSSKANELRAELKLTDGTLFTDFHRTGAASAATPSGLHPISVQVTQNNEPLGELILYADISQLTERRNQLLLYALMVLIAVTLVTMLLSKRLP